MQNDRLALLSAVTLTPLSPLFPSPLFLSTLFVLTLSLLTASASGSQAGPCPEIGRTDLGPSAQQSVAAQMHRQPTAASIAAAEKKVAAGAAARPPGGCLDSEKCGCPDSEKYGGPAEGDRSAK